MRKKSEVRSLALPHFKFIGIPRAVSPQCDSPGWSEAKARVTDPTSSPCKGTTKSDTPDVIRFNPTHIGHPIACRSSHRTGELRFENLPSCDDPVDCECVPAPPRRAAGSRLTPRNRSATRNRRLPQLRQMFRKDCVRRGADCEVLSKSHRADDNGGNQPAGEPSWKRRFLLSEN